MGSTLGMGVGVAAPEPLPPTGQRQQQWPHAPEPLCPTTHTPQHSSRAPTARGAQEGAEPTRAPHPNPTARASPPATADLPGAGSGGTAKSQELGEISGLPRRLGTNRAAGSKAGTGWGWQSGTPSFLPGPSSSWRLAQPRREPT